MPPLWGDVASVAAAAALAETARRARTQRVSAAETRLFRLVNGAPDSVGLPVWAVMQSGSLAAVFVVAGHQHLVRGKRQAIAATAAGVAVWAGVKAVKPLIGRGRPDRHLDAVSVRGQPQSGLGYPSGHAAVATTLAVIATRSSPPALRALAGATAGLAGAARMYVGAHLPLDVVGGTVIGLLSGRVANSALGARTSR